MFFIKKLLTFEKELLFKTKVSEITSISLEHNIDKIEEDLVSGSFYINGDYKMTQASINREKFDFTVGFDIALDSRYDTKNMVIDIDDFTYNVINDEVLKVKIDLYIDADIIKEEVIETNFDEEKEVIVIDNKKIEDITPVLERDIKIDDIIEDKIEEVVTDVSDAISNKIMDTIELNDNIYSQETYATYYVYIVKEDDTLETIMDKYKVSRDSIVSYNDINTLNVGDKIIIPADFDELS